MMDMMVLVMRQAGALKDCCVNPSAPLPSPYLPRVPYQGEVAPVLTLWERLQSRTGPTAYGYCWLLFAIPN